MKTGKQAGKATNTKPLTLKLPMLFPSMTRPDVIIVVRWNFKEGDVLPLDPDQCLLVVSCVYGEGSLLIPDFLGRPHRIVKILQPVGSTMQLGDPLFALEPVEEVLAREESVA